MKEIIDFSQPCNVVVKKVCEIASQNMHNLALYCCICIGIYFSLLISNALMCGYKNNYVNSKMHKLFLEGIRLMFFVTMLSCCALAFYVIQL